MRTDIPHAGAENLTENVNFRIHCFVIVEDWNDDDDNGGYKNKRVDWNNWKKLRWDENMFKFKYD